MNPRKFGGLPCGVGSHHAITVCIFVLTCQAPCAIIFVAMGSKGKHKTSANPWGHVRAPLKQVDGVKVLSGPMNATTDIVGRDYNQMVLEIGQLESYVSQKKTATLKLVKSVFKNTTLLYWASDEHLREIIEKRPAPKGYAAKIISDVATPHLGEDTVKQYGKRAGRKKQS